MAKSRTQTTTFRSEAISAASMKVPFPASNHGRDATGPLTLNPNFYAARHAPEGDSSLTADAFQRSSGLNTNHFGRHAGLTPGSVAPRPANASLNDSIPTARTIQTTTEMSSQASPPPAVAPTTAATLVQAAAASTTLINAVLVTQNPDGSTSVFGQQGNAIENSNSGGVTVFADPLTTASQTPVPIWYAPMETSDYFQNILNNPQMFSAITGGIAVFKMYAVMASWPDATVKAFLAYLSKNNIKLGFEAPALIANSGQPGYGIEGFAPAGGLISLVTRIQTLGGTLSYIGWDEPLYYGSISTGFYTVAQIAAQVAATASAVKAIFPNIQIGDIEPVGKTTNDAATLQAWFTAYAKVAQTPFGFFQADIATWIPGWQTQLANTIAVAHTHNVSVGVIVNGIAAANNNDAWATQAVANAQLILSDPVLRPDYLVVQSWQTYPSEAGDPSVAGTLASVAADVAASEKAALAVPAFAQYDTAGFLQSVTWTGGWTAVQDGSSLELLSPTGGVIDQYAWSNVATFAFDPNTATVSLTTLVLTSAAGAIPAWQQESFSIGAGKNGFAITAPVASSSPLTLGLASSSQARFHGSGITNQAMPTLTGTAAPGATVTLQADGTSIGTATAGNTGTWSYTFSATLGNGVHVIQAAFANNTTGVNIHQEYVLSVDTAQVSQPTLALVPGSDSGYPGDDITDVAQPVFLGVAAPDTEIALVIDGKSIATVETSLSGLWSYDLNTALALGAHTVSATAINPAGTSSAPATMQLTIDTAAQEAAVTTPDPLFDTVWYLRNHPDVAASGVNPYTQFMTVGWKEGYDPDPFFSTVYYLTHYQDVAASGMNPLTHFEQYGWQEGRNTAPNENTTALEQSVPAGEDPLVAYIQSLLATDALYTAVPNAELAVSLLHDTGASSSDGVTNDPTLAITADPGATVTLSAGTATPVTFTVGSSGSWSYAYAPASLADGSYAVAVTLTELGGGSSSATMNFTLDRTPPLVTGVSAALGTSATLGAGNIATITVTFSETVLVTGLPTLTLNDGGVAAYVAGFGGKTLTFAYTILAGQNTTALAVIGINLPSGATIADAARNVANLAGAASALTGPVVIETQLPITGSNITLSGTATVTATQSVNGYTVALAGTGATNAPIISANATTFGTRFALNVTGAGSAARYGTLDAIGSNVNNGTIETQAGSAGGAATLAINLSSGPAATGTAAASGVYTNAGTIDAEAGSTINITGTTGSTLVNTGSLVANGMMFLGTSVSGTGEIIIGTASNAVATLEALGALTKGQSILFDAGTLTIDHLSSFLATVSDFNAHDHIVLNNVNVTAVSYSNGTLLLNGGQAGTLLLQPATRSNLGTGSILLGHNGGATTITMS